MSDYTFDFAFVEDGSGGHFVPVSGPLAQLRALLARGEIEVAVRIYEDTEAGVRDALLEEAKLASLDTNKALGTMLRRARDFSGAARVFELARLDLEAAQSYEQAGDFAAAAACYLRRGEALKAAPCLERCGQGERAVDLYRQAGAQAPLAECLARQQKFEAAADLFRQLGNIHAEIEVLRGCLKKEPGLIAPARRMAELLVAQQRPEQAAEALMGTIRNSATARDDAGLLVQLAKILDSINQAASAAKVRARLAALGEATPVAAAPKPAEITTPGGYGFLKALPMFADLSLPDMKALYRACSEVSFSPGQHLIEAGQPGKGLFLIVAGVVDVYSGPEATARLLNSLAIGGYAGEISLVRDGSTSARVTARTEVKALFISRDAFTHYLFSNAAAALCIYRLFAQNLAERVRVLSAA